jgi:zinc protease
MRRSCSAALAVACVAACGAVLKPPAPDRRLNITQQGSMFEASNGYRFAVLPEPTARVIRLDVRYPVGAADDPKGKEGLAHLVEHMLFDVEYNKGGAKTSISAELNRLAINWNAETEHDFTDYQTVFAKESLEEVFGLEANRLAIGCNGLTPEIFAREREVVLNELRQRQGATGAELMRVIYEAIYPEGHAYRRVDSVDTVAKLELKDVCDFLANQYQQGKAIVVLSGDVNEDQIQHAAAKQFVRLRKRNLVERPTPPAIQPNPGTVKAQADLNEAGVVIATWPLPPMGTTEYRELELLWPRMVWSIGSRAYDFKWGHGAFAEVYGGAYAPVLAVGVYLESMGGAGDAKEAISDSVRNAFESLGHDRTDDRWRLYWQFHTEGLLARWESLGARNAMFGDYMMFDKAPPSLINHVAEIKEGSPGTIRDLARRWLSPDLARFLVLEPSGTAPMRATSKYNGGAEAHATQVDGKLADEALPPPPARARRLVERYQLGNGLNVVLWPYGSAPIVRGRLVIDSGSAEEPAGREGIASLVGADDVEPDSLVFEGRELSMVVDDLVRDLGFELRAPGQPLSEDEKDFLKKRLRNKRTMERLDFDTRMLASVYGEQHPYARPAMTESSVDKLHHDLVRDWARSHIVPRNATLVIAGQFDAELVKKHIAYNVDQVSGGSDSADVEPASISAIPRYVEGTALKPTPTVELDVDFLTAPGIDKDYAKRRVLEAVLDAELSKLRDKRALTYGFYASYSPRKGGGLWTISGDADASRAAEAATAVLEILKAMRANPESYRGSFVLARQKVIEELLVSATDSNSVAEELAFIARFDLGDTFFDRIPGQVAVLTLQDFHAFLTRELPVGRQVFGAFGNVDASKAAVAAARQLTSAP